MTSIEWLLNQININGFQKETIKQAKEMHKQEIIDAAERWKGTDFAERYYQETFVSKGSDEHIVDISKMVDDNVYEIAQEYAINSNSPNRESRRKGFIDGYNKAKETLYTEEQVKLAITLAKDSDYKSTQEIIQSLKQPKQ